MISVGKFYFHDTFMQKKFGLFAYLLQQSPQWSVSSNKNFMAVLYAYQELRTLEVAWIVNFYLYSMLNISFQNNIWSVFTGNFLQCLDCHVEFVGCCDQEKDQPPTVEVRAQAELNFEWSSNFSLYNNIVLS